MSSPPTSQNTSSATSSPVSAGSLSDSETPGFQQTAMFGQADFPVKTSALPESARDWLESGLDCTSSSIALLQAFTQDGWYSKTSPAFCPPLAGKTLLSSLEGLPDSFLTFLMKAGEMQDSSGGQSIQSLTGFSMRSFSEWPNDAAVCSLLAILETDALPRYFLSAKACQGILRRAERRGRELPEALRMALSEAATDTARSTS